MKHILVVFAVLAVCYTQSTLAIKCYQCKSLTDPNCGNDKIDSKSNIRQVDCDTQPKPPTQDQYQPVTKCNTIVTKDKAGEIISRDCQFEIVGQKEDVCSVSHSRDIVKCTVCKGELCNGSGAAQLVTMSLAALVALVAVQFAL